MKPTIICIGGGIAGIIATKLLSDAGINVILVERNDRLGGLWSSLSRTVEGNTFIFDQGLRLPVATGDDKLDQAIFHNINNSNWIRIQDCPREGHIFNNVLYDKNSCIDARQLEPGLLSNGLNELLARPCGWASQSNLADQINQEYGPTFAKHIFAPVMKRFTGLELDALAPMAHRGLIPQRLIVAGHNETIDLLKSRPQENRIAHTTTEDLKGVIGREYLYPRSGGVGGWVNQLITSYNKDRVEILTKTSVIGIGSEENRVTHLDLSNGKRIKIDAVVWTLAPAVFDLTKKEPQSNVPPTFMNVLLVHAIFDKPFKSNLHYIANYDPDGIFHRAVLYPNIYGESSLGSNHHLSIEIVLNPAESNLEAVKNAAILELEQYGVIGNREQMIYSESQLMKNIYPVQSVEFWRQSAEIRDDLSERFSNVAWIGRAGGNALFLDAIALETKRKISSLLTQLAN